MKEIKLTRGKIALVDDEDFDRVSRFKWYASQHGKRFVASRWVYPNHTLKMHRFILQVNGADCVDHIDGNSLNNQKANLRICSNADNIRGSSLAIDSRSGFKGVTKVGGLWKARVNRMGVQFHLGYFTSPVSAAHAYDEKAIELFGEFARTNKDLGLYEQAANRV